MDVFFIYSLVIIINNPFFSMAKVISKEIFEIIFYVVLFMLILNYSLSLILLYDTIVIIKCSTIKCYFHE